MRVVVPCERKFEIYHAVETQGLPRREVARQYGISPDLVEQIAMEVLSFINEHGSPQLLNIDPGELELVSLRRCFERLSFFQQTLLRQFYVVAGESKSPSAGVRLMMAVARLEVEQTRIAGRIAKVQQTMVKEGLADFLHHEYVREQNTITQCEDGVEDATLPPVGGCTEEAIELPPELQQQIQEVVLSLGPNASWENVKARLAELGLLEVLRKTPAQLPSGAQPALALVKDDEEEEDVASLVTQHPK